MPRKSGSARRSSKTARRREARAKAERLTAFKTGEVKRKRRQVAQQSQRPRTTVPC